MHNFRINVRLRPVRFAFMVRPEDKANLSKIFQINTCLWGGLYNPIIPFFKRVPAWWDRHGYNFDNARQIVNGYLDYFEPDFVVEAEKNICADFGIDPRRILPLASILGRSNEHHERGQGQTVIDLYQKLYREEFQFVRRHKPNVFEAKAADPTFHCFAACLFGKFPSEPNLKYFGSAFRNAFAPDEITLDAMTLSKLLKDGGWSALRIGCHGLDVDYNDHSDPTLFVLNALEPKDLLDFWNYRAVHRSGVPIPKQWLPELSSYCKNFILRNYRPLPGNPHGVMIRPLSMFSRSISENEIQDLFDKYLRVDKPDANTIQTWYPPIWRKTPNIMVRRTRPKITASQKEFDVQVDVEKPRASFESLVPDFADRFGGENRWANVIRLNDFSYKDRIATVLPSNFRIQAVPKLGFTDELFLSTEEGFISFPRYRDIPHYWNLFEGKNAIALWLNGQNISCELSESGRATEQIIQTLGGFWGVQKIAHKGVVTLLEEMSRRPITRSAHQREFENKINNVIKGEIWRNRVLETLVERKAVELGYELKCTKCGSWGWYALNQLNAVINCDLCLRQFDFPLTSPTDGKHAKWAYRVIGPFALPGYARGGYASALAIRFFADVIGASDSSEATWSPGQELTLATGHKIETDFLLWYRRKHLFTTNHPTQVVFGEAKSFGKEAFKEEDVNRMKLLAEQFPGAVVVFATLKEVEELSSGEVKRIRKLALWGREYDKQKRQSRAPVILLTGSELFAPRSVDEVWRNKGGRHKDLISPGYVHTDNLKTLADFTQQLYLGMNSYEKWRNEKYSTRRRKSG